MRSSGRTYIFLAATLLLLAASLKFYANTPKGGPGILATIGSSISSCQSQAVRTDNVQIGCKSDLTGGFGNGSVTSRGGAKTVQVGR